MIAYIKRKRWVIAFALLAWGFVSFGLPMINRANQRNSFRETYFAQTLKVCKELRVVSLTTHSIPISKGGDLAADKLDGFCNCANGDVNSFSNDEWKLMMEHHGDMLPSTEARREANFQKCLADARR
jgi:hypothetical protein